MLRTGRGKNGSRDDLHPEAQQLRQGPGHSPQEQGHVRRERNLGRISRHQTCHEPRGRQHLRRNARHTRSHHWQGNNWNPRILIIEPEEKRRRQN